MNPIQTPEGSLALAIAVLLLVLGWRFTLARNLLDVVGLAAFALADAVALAGTLGLLPARPAPLSVRLTGVALLVSGLLVAGASFRARQAVGPGVLCTVGVYARLRHPLYAGLGLTLVGNALRTPHLAGAAAVAFALGLYAWLARIEERKAPDVFGSAWETYARRTPALGLGRRTT